MDVKFLLEKDYKYMCLIFFSYLESPIEKIKHIYGINL
jgi:hypothetical protein